jgi:hypothetical protein
METIFSGVAIAGVPLRVDHLHAEADIEALLRMKQIIQKCSILTSHVKNENI